MCRIIVSKKLSRQSRIILRISAYIDVTHAECVNKPWRRWYNDVLSLLWRHRDLAGRLACQRQMVLLLLYNNYVHLLIIGCRYIAVIAYSVYYIYLFLFQLFHFPLVLFNEILTRLRPCINVSEATQTLIHRVIGVVGIVVISNGLCFFIYKQLFY